VISLKVSVLTFWSLIMVLLEQTTRVRPLLRHIKNKLSILASQIRNSKSEIRNKFKIQNSNDQNCARRIGWMTPHERVRRTTRPTLVSKLRRPGYASARFSALMRRVWDFCHLAFEFV
jgi:hypothetical protein